MVGETKIWSKKCAKENVGGGSGLGRGAGEETDGGSGVEKQARSSVKGLKCERRSSSSSLLGSPRVTS